MLSRVEQISHFQVRPAIYTSRPLRKFCFQATSQKNQEAANSNSTQQADCVVDDEISFIPPKRSSSPLSMNGQEHSKEMPPHPMTPGKLPLAKPTDILEGASDSDTSTESISLADNLDQSGMISLSDYIVSVKH